MNQRSGPHAPAHYEVRIEGHLDEYWSTWLGGLTLIREDDGTTTLRGAVTDQAELHGLLSKVHNLGVTLISVMSIRSVDDHDSPEQQHQ
jgi:GTPase